MKKIALTLILFGLLYGCKKEIDVFEVSMQPQGVVFTAIEGGAEMQYEMPNDPKVFSILVRYKNERGEDVLKVGGYGNNKIILDGFNQAQENIPATITLADKNNTESESINVSFSTLNSSVFDFFDNLKVEPFWGGFQVTYKVSDSAVGMVHILYVGINPITNSPDTLTLKDFTLSNKSDTIVFQPKDVKDKYDVVVRTEDSKGYRVREQVYKDVESYKVVKYDSEKLSLIDNHKLSIEDNKVDMVGAKYLFDGDTKGSQRLDLAYGEKTETAEVFSFLAGPNAVGKPFIVDLNEEKVPAKIHIYGMLSLARHPFPRESSIISSNLKSVWKGSYPDKLPCKVVVYASNNKDAKDEEWVLLGRYEQDRLTREHLRWSKNTSFYDVVIFDMLQLNAHAPSFMELNLKAQPMTYRYLKVVVEDVFAKPQGSDFNNASKFVTIHELEVYVKK